MVNVIDQRRAGGTTANARASTRRLSVATTTLILGVTLAAVQLFQVTTTLAAASEQVHTGVVADRVVQGAPGLAPGVGDELRALPQVAAATQVARTQVVAVYDELGDPTAQPYPAQGVSADGVDETLDLDVRAGDLAALRGDDTVALSRMAAATMGSGVGDTVNLRLGDGTAVAPTVVAVYGDGLGFGDVTLPHDVVVAHTTDRLDDAVLLTGTDPTDPRALDTAVGTVIGQVPGATQSPATAFAAATDAAMVAQTGVSAILNAVLLGYIAIAVVNTLVLSVTARSRELGLLRMVGAHPRQVRAVVRVETAVLVTAAVVIGTG